MIDPGVVVRGRRGIVGRVVMSIAADPNTWTEGVGSVISPLDLLELGDEEEEPVPK
jgi:hypothetical protein